MNCEEFRRRFQSLLDEKEELSAHSDLISHTFTCTSCNEYARSLREVDALLQNIPFVPLPRTLFPKLALLEETQKEILTSRSLKRIAVTTVAYMIVGVATLGLSQITESFLGVAVSFLLAVVALTGAGVQLLKRPLVGI